MTDFWLRDSLYRDTTQVPTTKFVTGDSIAAPIQTYTAKLHSRLRTGFLYRELILIAIKFVPRLHQHAIKIVPRRQKPSLLSCPPGFLPA